MDSGRGTGLCESDGVLRHQDPGRPTSSNASSESRSGSRTRPTTAPKRCSTPANPTGRSSTSTHAELRRARNANRVWSHFVGLRASDRRDGAPTIRIAVNDVADEVGWVFPAVTPILESSNWIFNVWPDAEMSIVLNGIPPSVKSVGAIAVCQRARRRAPRARPVVHRMGAPDRRRYPSLLCRGLTKPSLYRSPSNARGRLTR